eukprot:PhF_6_TR10366/c0_g2_i1/m.16093/K13303/SGK2; serum/glucocorticoid-regulated kinase 2
MPFHPLGCSFPWTFDCNQCVSNHFGPECLPCPGYPGTCNSHGYCLDGVVGNGTCVCDPGWSGTECVDLTNSAIAGIAFCVASLVLSAVEGGLTKSWTSFIRVIAQLHFGVLLGISQGTRTGLLEAVTTYQWIVHPISESVTDHASRKHIGQMLYNASFLIGTILLHVLLILIVFLALRKYQGISWGDAATMLRFPSASFAVIFFLQPGIIYSSMRVLTEPDPLTSLFALACVLIFALVIIAFGYYAYFLQKSFLKVPQSQWFADYIDRVLPNAMSGPSQMIYARAKGMVPAFLLPFLPQGYWTSQHLPLRGFNSQFAILYHEYNGQCAGFFGCVFYFVTLAIPTILGVQRTAADRPIHLGLIISLLGCYLIALAYYRPHRCLGVDVVYILSTAVNIAIVAVLLVDPDHLVAGYLQHANLGFLTLASCVIILTWAIIFIKDRGDGSSNPSQMGLGPEAPQEIKSLEKREAESIMLLEAEYVGMGTLKVSGGKNTANIYTKRWCEVRGTYFLYFPETDTENPLGIINLMSCAVEANPKKNKFKLTYLESGNRQTIHFRGENETEVKDWERVVRETRNTAESRAKNSGVVFAEGRSIDDYDIMGLLGKGTSGEVYKARDKATGELWAIKVVDLQESSATAILNETAVLQVMRHPYIVRLREALQGDDKVFLVMPYLTGGDLSDHVQASGGLTFQRVQFYAAEVLLAVEHLHANTIMHRDLKPQNVMIHKGHAILTDMGIAKVGKNSNTFCGTPYYVAPEIVAHSTYDDSVDWWSFGVMLYEMISGSPPFVASDVSSLFMKIRTQPPDFAGFPPDAVNLIEKMLDKNLKKRLTSPAKMKRHKFFEGINWRALAMNEVAPPRGWTLKKTAEPEFEELHSRRNSDLLPLGDMSVGTCAVTLREPGYDGNRKSRWGEDSDEDEYAAEAPGVEKGAVRVGSVAPNGLDPLHDRTEGTTTAQGGEHQPSQTPNEPIVLV